MSTPRHHPRLRPDLPEPPARPTPGKAHRRRTSHPTRNARGVRLRAIAHGRLRRENHRRTQRPGSGRRPPTTTCERKTEPRRTLPVNREHQPRTHHLWIPGDQATTMGAKSHAAPPLQQVRAHSQTLQNRDAAMPALLWRASNTRLPKQLPVLPPLLRRARGVGAELSAAPDPLSERDCSTLLPETDVALLGHRRAAPERLFPITGSNADVRQRGHVQRRVHADGR